VRACVRACVCACVHVCACVCLCAELFGRRSLVPRSPRRSRFPATRTTRCGGQWRGMPRAGWSQRSLAGQVRRAHVHVGWHPEQGEVWCVCCALAPAATAAPRCLIWCGISVSCLRRRERHSRRVARPREGQRGRRWDAALLVRARMRSRARVCVRRRTALTGCPPLQVLQQADEAQQLDDAARAVLQRHQRREARGEQPCVPGARGVMWWRSVHRARRVTRHARAGVHDPARRRALVPGGDAGACGRR
jgi:hypothetical protein